MGLLLLSDFFGGVAVCFFFFLFFGGGGVFQHSGFGLLWEQLASVEGLSLNLLELREGLGSECFRILDLGLLRASSFRVLWLQALGNPKPETINTETLENPKPLKP